MQGHIEKDAPDALQGTPDMRERGCDIIWTQEQVEEEDKPSRNDSLESKNSDSVDIDDTSCTIPVGIPSISLEKPYTSHILRQWPN